MNRLQGYSVLFLACIAAASWLVGYDASPIFPIHQGGDLDDRVRRRLEFVERVDTCLAQWESGKATLGQIVAQIKDHCEVFYPSYLHNLHLAESGTTVETQIAQNLLRHYRALGRSSRDEEAADRLRREIVAEWPCLEAGLR